MDSELKVKILNEVEKLLDEVPLDAPWAWLTTDDPDARLVSVAMAQISNWWSGNQSHERNGKCRLLNAAAALILASEQSTKTHP